MVHTPGFGGVDMPEREIQARMETWHGCVCLSHIHVCTSVSVRRKTTTSHLDCTLACVKTLVLSPQDQCRKVLVFAQA